MLACAGTYRAVGTGCAFAIEDAASGWNLPSCLIEPTRKSFVLEHGTTDKDLRFRPYLAGAVPTDYRDLTVSLWDASGEMPPGSALTLEGISVVTVHSRGTATAA